MDPFTVVLIVGAGLTVAALAIGTVRARRKPRYEQSTLDQRIRAARTRQGADHDVAARSIAANLRDVTGP
jgi:hypothetical protein